MICCTQGHTTTEPLKHMSHMQQNSWEWSAVVKFMSLQSVFHYSQGGQFKNGFKMVEETEVPGKTTYRQQAN